MKKTALTITSIFIAIILIIPTNSFAGNKQRAGQAGASELLINPWARSSGWGGAGIACSRGLDAIYLNIAGSAFTEGTIASFSHADWLYGTNIFINSFGLSQRVGEAGVLSLSIMSLDFDEIEITTVDEPEGGLGYFHPQNTNISLSFAKEFSNAIYGGATIKIISGGISDLSSGGVAIDAGIQYVTGENDQMKFGITMKNVGPTMKYGGDGMSFRGEVPETGVSMTVEQRSEDFELPSLIKIGVSYDFYFGDRQRLTTAAAFTSNSFTKDNYHLGVEYDFKNIFQLRTGYIYEDGAKIFEDDYDTRTNWMTGWNAGFSINIPLSKENGTYISIDYSFQDTDLFDNIHTYGATLTL